VAYADTRGRVAAYEPDTGVLRWRSRPLRSPRALTWSGDGTRLAAITDAGVAVLAGEQPVRGARGSVTAVAFRPRSHVLAVARSRAGTSEVLVGNRVVFRGTGVFGDLSWSPDGRWLLVTWPTADQWVFIRMAPTRRIIGVSNIRQQFGGGAAPRLSGWCCSAR
jgi:hypothetical protein